VNGAAHVPAIAMSAVSGYLRLREGGGNSRVELGERFLKVKLKSCLESEDERRDRPGYGSWRSNREILTQQLGNKKADWYHYACRYCRLCDG
jgi:hypothetical protein